MKKFNINDYMYVQITEDGWRHLKETVGTDYVNACIKNSNYERIINGEVWYKLQCWECFNLMRPEHSLNPLFKTTVMLDDESLKDN